MQLGMIGLDLRDGHFDLGASFDIHTWVRADNLHPVDMRVDLVYGALANSTNGHSVPHQTLPMAYTKREQDGAYRYDIHFQPDISGTLPMGCAFCPTITIFQMCMTWG
jgi:hypothetical protein